MEDWFSVLVGALIGALVSVLVTYFTLRFSYRQLFAETVSKNRMDWINIWRENISKFLACAELLIEHKYNCKKHNSSDGSSCNDCKFIEYEKEFYESRAMITSRLNMNEELHVLMFGAINQIDFNDVKEFSAKREFILDLERKILKPEWERVKAEARGKRK